MFGTPAAAKQQFLEQFAQYAALTATQQSGNDKCCTDCTHNTTQGNCIKIYEDAMYMTMKCAELP
jgi:hypothetical protein